MAVVLYHEQALSVLTNATLQPCPENILCIQVTPVQGKGYKGLRACWTSMCVCVRGPSAISKGATEGPTLPSAPTIVGLVGNAYPAVE